MLNISPAKRALHGFVLAHPGLTTASLAEAFGLPEALCAEFCAELADAHWLRRDPNNGWCADTLDATAETPISTQAKTAPFSMLFEQSLDGLFFMMLDEPLHWDDSIDKEQVLDQALQRQRITQVNDAMCRQYAAQPEQLLGLTPADFFAHDLDEGRRLWRQLFDTGRLHSETDERRFDGTRISIEGDYRCLYDAQGRIIGHFGVQRDVTERKAALRQLARSEARLRDLIACTADFIWEVDNKGRFTYLSGQVEQLLGYRQDELLGQSPFFMMDPPVAERMAALFEQAAAQGAALGEQENYLTGNDGQRRYFAFNGIPIRDDNGALIGYRGLNRDTTDKKQAHDALRASEELLRTLFELSPESIVLVDPETTLPLRFNRVAHERLGYSADEFAQLRVADYETGEDIAAVKAHIERIRLYGRDDFETRHRCRDGRLLNIVVSVQNTVSEGREVLYAMYRDVTDARRAQERLARSEAQFRGAFEIAPNGMALVDGEGRWLQVNEALCDVLGYSAEELLALDFQSISDPKGLDDDLRYLHALLSRQADEVRFEKYYIHKDGHLIPTLLSASAVRDDQDKLSFIVVHILDLTERRDSEAALLAAKEAAEAGNRAKGEFLANMSHEIRTPLNAMIGLTDLTLGTKLDARQRDHLEKVRQSSGALLDILNDILDYSKIEAGQVELARRRFQLRDLLDQLTALFQARVEAKGLDLLYRIAPEVPQALIGDPMRLGQVLNNLVGNAVKFTDQGRVELAISVVDEQEDEQEEDEQEDEIKLRFSVQDTGIGIAAGTLEHLFQAFTQADGSITRRYGGTGLGLSISQRLVSLMGGRITADSVAGQGSQFQFAVQFPLTAGISQRIGARPEGLAQSRILVVGNDPLTRDILGDILQSWGLPLLMAADCDEARQQIARAAEANSPIDLMLLNAKPCLGCLSCPAEAAPISLGGRPLRRFGEPPTPVVLMVTHLEQTQFLERSPASGLPRFLIKPVTPSALSEAIASATSSAIRPRTSPEPRPEPDTDSLQGSYILVAEDNPVNQIVAEEMLKRFGARVLIANNGREAVELALQRDIDAVLMDLQMPEMDGFEATRGIRAQKPMLPIIALTAAALERDRERCLAAGMNDHLGKPVSSARLLASLSPWVRPQQAQAPARADAITTAEDAPSIDRQAVSDLRRLITNNDYVPPEVLADLRRNASPSTQAVLSLIEQALARFDYDAAAEALEQLPVAAS